MSIEEIKRPARIDEDRIEELKKLFPEAFVDGKLDINILQEEVTGIDADLIEENLSEAYGLQWGGKREARRIAFLPPTGTLKPKAGTGVSENSTGNLLIEGDNLEALRVLKKSYSGRIKTIYIDPPYNTGSDFVYKDDFKEPIDSKRKIAHTFQTDVGLQYYLDNLLKAMQETGIVVDQGSN
jgi:adenine-specific DNA-methyltransferase